MTDYPLATVQVIWDAPDNPSLPKVALVNIPGNDDERYNASWGACNSDFVDADDKEKIAMFLAKGMSLIINDDIPPNEVHEVFSQVPEYRSALADVGGFDPEKV